MLHFYCDHFQCPCLSTVREQNPSEKCYANKRNISILRLSIPCEKNFHLLLKYSQHHTALHEAQGHKCMMFYRQKQGKKKMEAFSSIPISKHEKPGESKLLQDPAGHNILKSSRPLQTVTSSCMNNNIFIEEYNYNLFV